MNMAIIIKDFVKVLWETHSIHKMINFMYYDQHTIILKKDVFDIIRTKDFDIDQIGKEDIVVDLGACIGAFTLPAAVRAKKVYAVEPLFVEELTNNIKLNALTNIEVIGVGVGDKE